MSEPSTVPNPNLEYLKFIEPHLATKIVEFILKLNATQEIKTLNKNLSLKTKNFEKLKNENLIPESDITSLKSKTDTEIKDFEEKLKGFLNLAENCEKQKTHDLSFFSLGKKIIEQTPPIDIIQFSNLLFDVKDFSKASMILNSFSIFHENNTKTKSKAIYALYLLYSIKLYTQDKPEEITATFEKIVKGVEQLKIIFDSQFKKTDFDGVDKEQVDFREILVYRGYLLHWALFLIKYDITLFLDTLFNENYYSLVELSFTYLIKYLIVFAIINSSRKYLKKIKETISKKKNFINNHKDCFIILLEEILIYFNSKNAKKYLDECKNMMKSDFFLYEYIDKFDKKVKEFMLENYLILNENVDIEEVKFILDENDENTMKVILDKIKYLYPNANIKDEKNKILYEVKDDDINEYYKIKTEDLYSLTKDMVEFFKENKNNNN